MSNLDEAVASIQVLIGSYEQKLTDTQAALVDREQRLAQIAELAAIPQPEPEPAE